MSLMSSRSEDEWSLVSDDEGVLSDTSFDEVEPELDSHVEAEQEVQAANKDASATCSEELVAPPEELVAPPATALELLADTNDGKRSTSGYSREIRASLLSPAHQVWFVGAPSQNSPANATDAFQRSNIKLAFSGPSVRPKSFPDRLRALTAAMRPLPEEVAPPTFTQVTAFMQDQSTQVNLDAATHDSRATLLQSALDRAMMMANQIRTKSQDNERLSFRIAELESVAVQDEQKAQPMKAKIKFYERSIALAKQQARLNADYQDNLKMIADNLRRENDKLEDQNALLRGDDTALAVRSLGELEELEAVLTREMDRVRTALRAKYRAAMQNVHQKELCIVCFTQPVAVVLLPCRHQALCASCAVRVTTCPIDRKDIEDKVLTYGLSAYTHNGN
ncbi:unnamed protein product [Phytophthora lilii]|uniref:Unnamed protein product n=1 Tax=Phytophthora lilii TaxID=2077276 RepID=A0A9W6U969_9STRA|nr:unnamed protein product [Phytophthora lilii]